MPLSLNLGTVVQNQGKQAESCRVRWQILDAAGKTVATADSAPQSVAADGSATFTAQRERSRILRSGRRRRRISIQRW